MKNNKEKVQRLLDKLVGHIKSELDEPKVLDDLFGGVEFEHGGEHIVIRVKMTAIISEDCEDDDGD